ncbi:hypothetical protein D3Z52_15015 [Clostridiaceae bacterium]|nr:hypothetical protein [Clostridiaceae bacterium]
MGFFALYHTIHPFASANLAFYAKHSQFSAPFLQNTQITADARQDRAQPCNQHMRAKTAGLIYQASFF